MASSISTTRITMRALILALGLMAAPALAVDHQRVDIPVAYRGTWALDASLCKERDLGPAFVQIGARRVSFYEEHGYLSLAQLNEIDDPPEFFGRFSFVHSLLFADDVIRLNIKAGKLLITRNATVSDEEPSQAEWTRCSKTEPS